MDITLINPPNWTVYSGFNRGRLKRMPLGIAYIAAFLEKHGHRISIVEAEAHNWDNETAAEEALKNNPQIVGITSTTPIIHNSMDIIKRVKQKNPDVFTMVGGPHAGAIPKETLSDHRAYLDYAVSGEGEYTTLDIVTAIEKGKPFSYPIPGVYFIGKNGDMVEGPPRIREKDLEKFPFPARHLFPLEKYLDPVKFGDETYTLIVVVDGHAWMSL